MAARIISSSPIVLFTWSTCPYCKKAKALLNDTLKGETASNVKIVELDVMGKEGDDIKAEIFKTFNHETVPAVFIGSEFIGGFSDLSEKDKSGELAGLLSKATKK